jgi:hypothetical protein
VVRQVIPEPAAQAPQRLPLLGLYRFVEGEDGCRKASIFNEQDRRVSTHRAQTQPCRYVLERPLLPPAAVHEEDSSLVTVSGHTRCPW